MTESVCIAQEYLKRYPEANDQIPPIRYSFQMETETIGDRIRAARKLRDWSQEDLGLRVSQLIGRNPPYGKAAVSKWEDGTTGMVPGDAVWALIQLLGIPHDLLLWGPDKKPPAARRHPATPMRKPSFPRE